MSKKKRLTIMAAIGDDDDIINRFSNGEVTEPGLELLRGGLMLEKADILDALLLAQKKNSSDVLPMDLLKQAIAIAELMTTQPASMPSENKHPAKSKSVFG